MLIQVDLFAWRKNVHVDAITESVNSVLANLIAKKTEQKICILCSSPEALQLKSKNNLDF